MKKVVLALVFSFIYGVGFAQEKSENEAIDDSEVYIQVDEIASPVKGLQDFYKKFSTKFQVPVITDKTVTRLTVMLSFVIEKDGSFSNVRALRDPGYGMGQEAVRVMKSMDKWNSGKNNGQNVRSKYTLPITVSIH